MFNSGFLSILVILDYYIANGVMNIIDPIIILSIYALFYANIEFDRMDQYELDNIIIFFIFGVLLVTVSHMATIALEALMTLGH